MTDPIEQRGGKPSQGTPSDGRLKSNPSSKSGSGRPASTPSKSSSSGKGSSGSSGKGGGKSSK